MRAIAQTADGYLWFATRDGLARFDGVHFVVFNKENSEGIGHDMFGALLADHRGRLWIATGSGLSCYEGGRFRRYTVRDGLPNDAIHSLLEDGNGNIWIGTWNGLAVFDGLRFHVFGTREGLLNTAISGLATDGQSGVWVGTFGGGLAHFADGRFVTYTKGNGLPSDVIETVLRDSTGELWIGTLKGFARATAPGRFEAIPEIPGRSIGAWEDQTSHVWAVTEDFTARLDRAKSPRFEREPELDTLNVETLFEDKEGSFWVGTAGHGVARYRRGAFTAFVDDKALDMNRGQVFFQDLRGRLWIGTSHGVSRIRDGHLVTLRTLGDVNIRAIAEDGKGRLWFGTEHGVSRLDRDHTRPVTAMPSEVHALYVDGNDRIWAGSPDGIAIWNNGRINRLTVRDGLPSNYVMAIIGDHNGGTWIGTTNGLAHISKSEVTVYTKAQGMLTDYVSSLYLDSEGVLWICTPSGLHRLKDGKINSFTFKDGLPADTVLHVLEDDDRRLWISSFRGIFRIDKEQLEDFAQKRIDRLNAVLYGTDDGMKSAVCTGFGTQAAGWRDHEGALWFPSEQGPVRVQPSGVGDLPPPPQANIESIAVDGQPIGSHAIGPDWRRAEFSFTAPTSVAPELVEFRYRMTGFENLWREIGGARQVTFTSLPHGSYRFDLQARRKGGTWNPLVASAVLRVQPHFYETWWFSLSVGFLGSLLLWFIHSRRLHHAEDRLGAVMRERTRLAQELHDTMLQSLSGTAMQVQAAVRHMSHGDSDTGVQQLNLALNHLEKAQADARRSIWDMQSPEEENRSLDESLRRACHQLCLDGPALAFESHGPLTRLAPDTKRQIFRVGVEAVANAVRHSGTDRIELSLVSGSGTMRLRVRDYGCGFHPSLWQSGLPGHWGVSGMNERARECGGQLMIHSEPSLGTIVELEVPVVTKSDR
ncbi:MAG TPA: two-component regulator propeller domain-containing protein [Acidisarcina sp.]